jgi:CRISPR-associated exonuclease Cas4
MNNYIRVSDITEYLRCPRKVYYAYQEHRPLRTITPSYIASLLLKEMAYEYAEVVLSNNRENKLHELLDRVIIRLPVIYSDEILDIDSQMIQKAATEVQNYFEKIKNGIMESVELFGTQLLLNLIPPHDPEPILYSSKFHFSGSPDRILMLDGIASLSIIRTGTAPQTGIWKNDRIRLTALAILVEENSSSTVDQGVVEYSRYGIIRRVKIKRTDRRKVMILMGRIRKIKHGRLPEQAKDAPCDYCVYKEFCHVSSTLASRFF